MRILPWRTIRIRTGTGAGSLEHNQPGSLAVAVRELEDRRDAYPTFGCQRGTSNATRGQCLVYRRCTRAFGEDGAGYFCGANRKFDDRRDACPTGPRRVKLLHFNQRFPTFRRRGLGGNFMQHAGLPDCTVIRSGLPNALRGVGCLSSHPQTSQPQRWRPGLPRELGRERPRESGALPGCGAGAPARFGLHSSQPVAGAPVGGSCGV
jgi:hypothetical protein